MKLLLLLWLLLGPPAVVQAQFTYTNNYGIWSYTTKNGTITIRGYTGPGGAVTIPSTITGLPVTTIGTNAFYHCTFLTSVTIGTNVTSIGEGAFCLCSSLASVTIPNSVTSIERDAFSGCTSLTSVTIGNSLTNIDGWVFSGCCSLTNVTIL